MLSIPLLLTIAALVGILLIYLGRMLLQMRHERNSLRQELSKYQSLTSREEQLYSNIQLKQNELQELDIQQEAIRTSIKTLQTKLRDLEAKEYLISIDDYEPKYDFVESDHYLARLREIKEDQKRMRDNKEAFICNKQWSIGKEKNGEEKGKRMTKGILKLIEIVFEKQCKYAKEEVSYNNIDDLKEEIKDSFDKINRYLQQIESRISEHYLTLKLRELDLQYEFEEKKQQEKEREQEIKRKNRDIEKNEKIDRKIKEAEEREQLHQQELDKLRQEIEQTTQSEVEKRKQLEFHIQQLEKQIVQARSDKDKAKREDCGYIYIISNIGSFRERDVYRICKTYRHKPDEFIRELNPAVPFRFDVHFKIFSENPQDTLERLHRRFDDKRVNLENPNREFFKVPMNEIEQAVEEIKKTTRFLMRIEERKPVPQAYEYRQTLNARKKHQQATTSDTYLEEDEIA
jgi:hypothetical protein